MSTNNHYDINFPGTDRFNRLTLREVKDVSSATKEFFQTRAPLKHYTNYKLFMFMVSFNIVEAPFPAT